MMKTEKTFGQHIADGLTFLGYSFHKTVQDAQDHELEQLKSGFVNDEYKLRMLKQDLYQAARARANPEHIQNLRCAIATLSNEVETERTHRNSLGYQVTGILNSIILLAIIATGFSFPATWTCNVFKNQSQACQISRIIPTATLKFFSEPK